MFLFVTDHGLLDIELKMSCQTDQHVSYFHVSVNLTDTLLILACD